MKNMRSARKNEYEIRLCSFFPLSLSLSLSLCLSSPMQRLNPTQWAKVICNSAAAQSVSALLIVALAFVANKLRL